MQHNKVQVALINSDLESLVLFQVTPKRGSFWQNITGSCEPEDQNLYASAKRELKEESGIVPLTIEQLPLTFTFTDRWNRQVKEFCFLATTNSSNITLSSEHQKFTLLPIKEVTPQHFKYASNFECFQQAVKQFYA
jgi:8-oxo-dGTP pyrophosphatase MutT (NUDIX family)